MPHHVSCRRRMMLAALGLATVAPAAQPARAIDAAEARSCPGARAQIADASRDTLRRALLCLVNRKRADEGLAALRRDRKLERAARRHARDMVEHGYFAHQRDGGPSLSTRLDRAHWHGTHWGETIAYGCGRSGTPRSTLHGWLDSAPHRKILLSGTYRRAGLGLGAWALCGADGVTWVLDVGRKR